MKQAQHPARHQYRHAGIRRLGYAVMAALLVLALIFFRERAWFLDIAYQTFLLLNAGSVQVQVYRFGAALVQVLPLLAAKLNAPLALVSLLYSASFPLFYLLFYWLIVRVFRNDYLGWALVWLFTLIVYDGFYWATNELQQGLGFLLVFFAFLQRYPALDHRAHWLFIAPGLVALVFYHPLVFIPALFIWLFLGLLDPALRHPRYLAVLFLLLLLLYAKHAWLPNYYDNQKYGNFFHNLQQYYPNYFALPSHRLFLQHMIRYWYGFPVLLLALTGYYGYRRQWLRLLLVWGACFGYLMLVHISDPETPYRFYAEVNYYPLVLFVAVPFFYDWAPRWRPQWLFGLLLATALLRLTVITLHHRPFTDRLQWLRSTVAEARRTTGGNRFYLPESQAPLDTLLMTWGAPFETLLLTAAEHPDSAATLFLISDPEQYEDALAGDTLLVNAFRSFPLDTLNENYYRLGQGRYAPIGGFGE